MEAPYKMPSLCKRDSISVNRRFTADPGNFLQDRSGSLGLTFNAIQGMPIEVKFIFNNIDPAATSISSFQPWIGDWRMLLQRFRLAWPTPFLFQNP